MSKKIETGLVVGGAKVGQVLLQAAVEANNEAQQKQVVDQVQTILVQIRKQEEYRDNADANIVKLQRKVTALQKGDFNISVHGKLTFKDEELNKSDLIKMKECTNCGYPTNR